MSRPLILLAFLMSLSTFAFPPNRVVVYYQDSNGDSEYYSAKVEHVHSADVPVNGDSFVPFDLYRLTFTGKDGVVRTAFTADQLLHSYEDLAGYHAAHRSDLVRVERSTGGFSPGQMSYPYMRIGWSSRIRGRLAEEVGLKVKFGDFARTGGDSHEDPVANRRGEFEEGGYSKRATLEGWRDGKPQLKYIHGDYIFPDLDEVNLKQQRFLIDFGKSPFDSGKQLLYPVYVDRYEGDDAVIVAPHEMQKLEKSRVGEKVRLSYWVVPRSILRVAPSGDEGESLLTNARSRFIDDMGIVQERKLPVATIIRANRPKVDQVIVVTAGNDLGESVLMLRRVVSEIRGVPSPCDGAIAAADGAPSPSPAPSSLTK